MDRNKLITHILNNISELQSLTKGMESMVDVPQFLHSLALEKVDNLKRAFLDLSVAKDVVEEEPKVEEIVVNKPKIVDDILAQTDEEHVDELQSVLAELSEEEEVCDEISADVEVEQRNKPIEQEKVVKSEPEVVSKPVQTVSTDKPKSSVRGFGSVRSAEGRFVKDLKKALNLNDRIRYRKELFGGDNELMTKTIDRLDVCLSLNEALEYVSQFGWPDDNEAVVDFLSLLERRFSK